jgi:hypothetical protein
MNAPTKLTKANTAVLAAAVTLDTLCSTASANSAQGLCYQMQSMDYSGPSSGFVMHPAAGALFAVSGVILGMMMNKFAHYGPNKVTPVFKALRASSYIATAAVAGYTAYTILEQMF